MLLEFYVTGKRRGLGKYWSDTYLTTEDISDADVIINSKHETQVEILETYAKTHKIITIGSMAVDRLEHVYDVEKRRVQDMNTLMYHRGYDVTLINFGYFDTERSAHKDVPKLSLSEVEDVIRWALESPHRIKELSLGVRNV